MFLRAFVALAALCVSCLPAAAQQAVTSQKVTVTIAVGEGKLFRLDRDASNVFVANSTVADVQIASSRMIYVYGRKVGATTLTAVGTNDNIAGSMTIRVERSAEAPQAAMTARGSAVTLGFAGDRLVIRGPVADVGEAMEVDSVAHAYSAGPLPPLDRTKLAGAQQITLRVRIAEVARNDLNRLGVNIRAIGNPGSLALNIVTNSFGSLINGDSSGESSLLAALGLRTKNLSIDSLINALQREGMVTLLAEPNLTTLSGETASFLAGGEVPIPIPQALGVTSIMYKQFGVALAFTPTLLPGSRLAMRVRTEVSDISQANAVKLNGFDVPSFDTRRAEANVELASGQTIAMAGLFQRRQQDNLDQIPFLGDVPILGSLFRSKRFQRADTELMILITPFLSVPVSSPTAIPLPTDDSETRPRPLSRAGFVVN